MPSDIGVRTHSDGGNMHANTYMPHDIYADGHQDLAPSEIPQAYGRESLTDELNVRNINYIRQQIAEKKRSSPYRTTIVQAGGVVTDYDEFPYRRYFRGVAESTVPIVAEREAGWRPRHDNCYSVNKPAVREPNPYPNHCFSAACSTVFPCYMSENAGDADTIRLNRSCISQYR
jgi:hypothetical protein